MAISRITGTSIILRSLLFLFVRGNTTVLSEPLKTTTEVPLFEITHGLPINKAIIWGHKLGTHTHSYIHYAFYKTFKHLGFETYWLDNNDDISRLDLSNAIFITEGQVDQKIPLRDDCFYVLHYIRDMGKYEHLLNIGHAIKMFPYKKEYVSDFKNKLDEYVFYNIGTKSIYMPWATDLLPNEIDTIKKELPTLKRDYTAVFIGTVWGGEYGNVDKVSLFKRACKEYGIPFKILGGWQQAMNISPEENIHLTQKAYLAPTIVGQWQCDNWYIPCRIFKNISYGQLGITNSETVYNLFNKKIVYNPDPYRLFYDAIDRMQHADINATYELMDFVKTKHTYINRIDSLFYFLALVQQSIKNS